MLTKNSNIANALLSGPVGLCIAIVLYAVLAWVAFATPGDMPLEGRVGVCFPSPNEWHLSPWLSFGCSAALTALCVLLAVRLNARFSIVPGTDLLYVVTFIVATGSIPWINQRLSSPLIITAIVLICTNLLFALYGCKHTAQGLCVIFSLLSWGSMVQYAFVLIMPIFLLGVIFMGLLRIREIIGIIFGIICPYWIMIGLGVVDIHTIAMPTLTNLFTGFTAPGALFFFMLGQGLVALVTLLLTASNSLASNTTGQQHRSYNAFLNLLGTSMIWFMLFDSSNMLAYTVTLALSLGFQAARFAANPRNKFAYLPVVITLPALIALFILILP